MIYPRPPRPRQARRTRQTRQTRPISQAWQTHHIALYAQYWKTAPTGHVKYWEEQRFLCPIAEQLKDQLVAVRPWKNSVPPPSWCVHCVNRAHDVVGLHRMCLADGYTVS